MTATNLKPAQKCAGFLFCGFFLAVAAVNAADSGAIDFKGIEKAEKKFNLRQRHQSLAVMDVDEIFPDPAVQALARAAAKGNLRELNDLAAKGVDVNSKGWENATPLYWAFRQKNKSGFSELLRLGATPNVRFESGGALMRTIALDDDLFYLEEALRYKVDFKAVFSDFGETLLSVVVRVPGLPGTHQALDLVLAAGADVNVRMKGGTTPVLSAANASRFDRVIVLLQHGADPGLKNDRGEDLKSLIEQGKKSLRPNSEQYSWLLKVEQYLESNFKK